MNYANLFQLRIACSIQLLHFLKRRSQQIRGLLVPLPAAQIQDVLATPFSRELLALASLAAAWVPEKLSEVKVALMQLERANVLRLGVNRALHRFLNHCMAFRLNVESCSLAVF